MGADDLAAQIHRELEQITALLMELTSLPSRWSGTLELTLDAGFQGRKPFRCDILIRASLASQDARWRTLIHEALHSVSAGYSRTAYEELPGWEEGVVEQLQRIYRPVILQRLGVTAAEEIFTQIEAAHLYNRYIRALEDMRQALNILQQEFYLGLLQTPLRDRPGFVIGLGKTRSDRPYQEFLRLFARSNVTLKE